MKWNFGLKSRGQGVNRMEEKKEKVLIVEDETKLARFVELELKHEGYEVFVANDGRSGIESYFEHEPDIILLDLMLPQLNGIEVCRRIRKECSYYYAYC